MRFYPLKIEAEDATRSTTLLQTFHVTMPFQASSSGDFELPELSIPYFDPQTERLNTVVLAKQHFKVVSPLRETAVWLGGVVLAIIVLTWPVRWVGMKISQQLLRRKALGRIRVAQDVHALKSAALEFDAGGAQKYQASTTLRRWLRDASVTYQLNADLRTLVFQLERSCYATNVAGENFPEFKSMLLEGVVSFV